ncbi:THAP domain-containing protein 2-like, partial [Aphis craccivora]
MTLCSVFGCASNNDRKRKNVNNDNSLHFYTFPKRNKSPLRHRKWENFCKRKNFKPSAGSVICSKHFLPLDFNQLDVLKRQLMPESKFIIRLNPNAVPSIQISTNNSKISTNPRQESLHILKKRQTEIIDDMINTSTPKKKMTKKSSCFEEIDDISAIKEPEVNNKIKKTSETGIQCELGNENLITVMNSEKKNLSFEIESESED